MHQRCDCHQQNALNRCVNQYSHVILVRPGRLPALGQGHSAGVKLNFWPPMDASYIRPPLARVNTATPLL